MLRESQMFLARQVLYYRASMIMLLLKSTGFKYVLKFQLCNLAQFQELLQKTYLGNTEIRIPLV
jgi:hypothetical protein